MITKIIFRREKMNKRKLTKFGERVKDRLIEVNMTQKTLAKKIGTSEVYLSMILYGERSGNKYKQVIEDILFVEMDEYISS